MEIEKILIERTNKRIYKSGKFVVKEFDTDFSKSDILNEALNQARVEETGLKIPQLEEVKKIDGKWAIVLDYIEGKTLAEIIENDRKNLEMYMEKFVDIQIEIHSKRSPLLNKLKDKMSRKIDETNLDATTRYELHTRLEGMPKHNKVCHGDFNPSNIIITPAGDYYVLDWSHATQGNASADVARTYLWMLINMPDYAENYLERFCNETNTSSKYVHNWIPIVAAARLGKKNPGEEDLLNSLISIIEY